jgi:hypothetical protein
MNQIVNIFRKDGRQLWMEIVASLALLSFFTYFEPKTWVPGYPSIFNPVVLEQFLLVLLCTAWTVMTVRLVQSERLVGLNQFWTTRPYEWPQLMAAKALFVVGFLYVPLAISQIVLLYESNLPIGENLGPLLANLLVVTASMVLPVAAIATLTGSFGQAALTMLGGLAVLVATASSTAYIRGYSPRGLTVAVYVILAAVFSAVVLNQYSRRATRRSFLLLAILPAAIVPLVVCVPGSSLAVRGHPVASGEPPISIRFDEERVGTAPRLPKDPKQDVLIRVPLALNGIAPGMDFDGNAWRITLTGDDGYSWQSEWEGAGAFYATSTAGRPGRAAMDFAIPRRVYDRLSGENAMVRLEFTLAQLEDTTPMSYALSMDGDRVPDLGVCALDESFSMIYCRSALERRGYFLVDASRKLGPCTSAQAELEPARGHFGDPRPAVLLPHISPVESLPLRLSGPQSRQIGDRNLCEGLPITFVEKRVVGRVRVEMPAHEVEVSRLGA